MGLSNSNPARGVKQRARAFAYHNIRAEEVAPRK